MTLAQSRLRRELRRLELRTLTVSPETTARVPAGAISYLTV